MIDPKPETETPAEPKAPADRPHIEDEFDEALDESLPGSDPPAVGGSD